MTKTHAQQPSRYCLACRHNLHGLSGSTRCPECGRTFDPDNPRTFSKHPFGDNWAALASLTRFFILFSALCTALMLVMSAWGFHPLWHLWFVVIPMLAAIVVVPSLVIVISIAQLLGEWQALNRKWMISGLALIAMFISIAITQWPLRLNFLLHKSALEREANNVAAGVQRWPQTSEEVSRTQWIGLLRIRRVVVLHNRNVGFQLSGEDGEGLLLVRASPDGQNMVWYNSAVHPVADNWYIVSED